MTLRSRVRAYCGARRSRGVAMLFLLAVIPVLFAFAALAVDVSRLLEAHRSVQQAAEEAAQSGATAYLLGTGEPILSIPNARAEAQRNWNIAVTSGVITADRPRLDSIEVTSNARTVVVTATADVTDLVFLRYFTIVTDDGVWSVTATGSATVCLAGFADEEACTRPDAR